MLSRRPDEFGLVPQDGSYRLKDVLKALQEEGSPVGEGRLAELNVLAAADGEPAPLAIEGGRISWRKQVPPEPSYVDEPPALLYGFCRRRAHAHVTERGLGPSSGEWVVLAEEKAMAERLGRRIDREPIIIVVQARRAAETGQVFHRLGQAVYLTDEIAPHLLTLPPPPKDKPDREKPARTEPRPRMPAPDAMPGSFRLGVETDDRKQERRRRERSKKARLKERRRRRRGKEDRF